jgi:tetratricopeptide (TPR) repeat protein
VAETILAQDNDQIEAHAVRAAALYDLRQYEAAAKAAEAAQKLAPNHLLAIRVRAQALIDGHLDKDLPLAIRLLQVYVREQPTDTERQRLLIHALRKAGRSPEEIIEALKVAVANAPPEEQPSLMLKLAATYLEARDPAKVIEMLEEMARRDSSLQSAQWWQFYGDAQRQDGQSEAALQSYHQGLELDPTHQLLLERSAEVSENLGDWPRAAEGWQRLVEVNPDYSKAHLGLAQARRHQGDPSGALSAVQRALVVETEYGRKAEGYQLKAKILDTLERPQQEIAEAYYEAGRWRYWNSEFQAAADLFKRASKLNDQHLPTYWYWADTLRVQSDTTIAPYVDRDKIKRSLEVWEMGFKHGRPSTGYPDFSWAYVSRALINEQLARLRDDIRLELWWEAIVYLSQAILLNKTEANRWAYLGRLHRFLENKATALQATRQALAYNSGNLALDERAVILADVGDFSAALELIDKRQNLASGGWLNGIKAYVLYFEGQYEVALQLLNSSVESEDDIWSRNLRASCYRMLDKLSSAHDDYAWIWERHTDPAFSHIDNQSRFAWAAARLASLSNQPELLDEAIKIFEKLRGDPTQRVSSDLAICLFTRGGPSDVERGKQCLEEGLRQAINAPELESNLKHDLPLLEKQLSQWPHGEQVRAVLEQVKPKIKARRDELETARPHSAEEEIVQAEQELKKEVENPERRGPTQGWARIGAQAELARLYTEKKQWSEAAAIYQLLQKESDRFPEAHVGLESIVDELQKEGDSHLEEGDASEAVELFRQALSWERELSRPDKLATLQERLGFGLLQDNKPDAALSQLTQALNFVCESFANDKKRQADLHSQLGYINSELRDLANARRNFIKAIELYQGNGTLTPGESLGTVCRSLLKSVRDYWALEDVWKAFTDETTTDESLRSDLAAARKSLANYLDELYQLSEQSGKSSNNRWC